MVFRQNRRGVAIKIYVYDFVFPGTIIVITMQYSRYIICKTERGTQRHTNANTVRTFPVNIIYNIYKRALRRPLLYAQNTSNIPHTPVSLLTLEIVDSRSIIGGLRPENYHRMKSCMFLLYIVKDTRIYLKYFL